LKRLLCDADNRLGAGGIQEVKKHPFFKGLDWERLRAAKAPFTPEVKDDEDCSRFDKFDEEAPFYPEEDSSSAGQLSSAAKKNKKRKDINFPGYTYKKEVEDQKSKLVQALKGLLNSEGDHGGEAEDDGYQSPPEQEQKIPKQQVRSSAPSNPHQSLQAAQQQNQGNKYGQMTRQQTIEQKNKQIVIKNTNVGNSSAQRNQQQPAANQHHQQYYGNNNQIGQGASQGASSGTTAASGFGGASQPKGHTIPSQQAALGTPGAPGGAGVKVPKQALPQKQHDDGKQRVSAMN
jgi:hypothetical protein